MSKFIKYLLIFSIAIFFTSCSDSKLYKDETLKIAVSNWVGYTPLLYAYEMDRLNALNIEIVSTTSASTSVRFVKRDVVDAFLATQWEYNSIKGLIEPIIVINESFGGDKILANITKEDLYKQKHTDIDVQMEVDSINSLLYNYLIDSHTWEKTNFSVKNNSQSYINSETYTTPTLIITCEPYATNLINSGYIEIVSSSNPDIFIVDALFVRKEVLSENKNKFPIIQKEIALAIKELENNPVHYYSVIKHYLEGQSYENFLKSVKTIKWVNLDKKSFEDIYSKEIF